jgi:hypothetical protein
MSTEKETRYLIAVGAPNCIKKGKEKEKEEAPE